MSRFVYNGHNWEGREFHVAVSLRVLGDQITAMDQTRYKVDGTVASMPHDQVSPNSDHRPDNSGWVRAIDWGGPDELRLAQCEALRLSRDSRIKYVINEARMFSSYPAHGYDPYTWRPYSGVKHDEHSHLSTVDGGIEHDPRPWDIGGPTMEHEHTPPAGQIHDWATEGWEQWCAYSGTNPDSRGWNFQREDLGWVFGRVLDPMLQDIAALQQTVHYLQKQIDALEPPQGLTLPANVQISEIP